MQYNPLDFVNFEFRLLTILPASPDDVSPHTSLVHCTLNHAFLHDQPSYQALSYCWGEPAITVPIKVDDAIVLVTTNLEAGLRQLRSHGISTIWVDALCINQNDAVERGLQVMRMGLIYSKAERVIVWLGVSAEESEKAIEKLRKPQNLAINREDEYGMEIRALFRRPYWNRVWIIQEVSKAKDVEVFCGGERISWKELESAWSTVPTLLPPEICSLRDFRTRQQTRGGPQMSLCQALSKTQHCISSDKRDKIYALLNITADGAEMVPTPNYKLPVDSVFFRAIKELVATNPNLSYLATRSMTLPSRFEKSPVWSDIGTGVCAWILKSLETGTFVVPPRPGRSDSARTPSCPPTSLPWNPQFQRQRFAMTQQVSDFVPYLSEDGLIAPGRILDTIKSTRDNIESVFPDDLILSAKGAEISTSAVLKSSWKALVSVNFLSSEPHDHLQDFDHYRAAYALTALYHKLQDQEDHNMAEALPQIGFLRSLLLAPRPVLRGRSIRQWLELYSQTEAFKEGWRTSEGWTVLGKWITLKGIKTTVTEDQYALLQSLSYARSSNLQLAVGNRRFFGWVPDGARSGDVVARIYQAAIPVVLRPIAGGYQYIGEAYSGDFGSDGPARVDEAEKGIVEALHEPTADWEILSIQ